MKIAVTYDNGEVYQHFGHTSQFMVYTVEDKNVVSSEILDANGSGHEALATLLADNAIDTLICGGIGGGAFSALLDAGIEIVAGTEGNADDVVKSYLAGNVESSGVNCDHHGEGHTCGDHSEGHTCGGSEEEACGCSNDEEGCGCGGCSDDEESCGGGCGGCHGCHSAPAFEGKNVGKTCKTHYVGTFNDGTQFDSSYDRGTPLEFVCGSGMMIYGFDKAVANMNVGETIEIHLTPDEAYGESDPNAIVTMDIAQLPGSEDLTVGEKVYLQDMFGRPIPVVIVGKTDTTITFDANHEMAGKELNFKIELVDVQ